MKIKDFLLLIDIDENKLIKKVKDGYLLPFSTTPVMFLTNDQKEEFNSQKEIIALRNEYNEHIRKEKEINESNLYQIRNIYDGANLGFEQICPSINYNKVRTFTTYKEALNYMIENNLLLQGNRIYPVKFNTTINLELV